MDSTSSSTPAGGRTALRLALIASLASLSLAAIAPSAGASVTLGETFAPNGCSVDTYIQTSDPGSHYRVPSNGTITSWSFQADAGPPTQMRFKVARPEPGADLSTEANITVRAQSPLEAPVANQLNTYPVQIPVQAGDNIGFYVSSFTACSRSDDAFTDHYNSNDVQPGVTDLFTQENYQLDLSAVFVPTNTFTVGTIARNKKKGTATLNLDLPNAGELTGSGSGAQVASAGGAVISKSVGQGKAQLLIKAKGKKKKTLNQTGKVKLKIGVTFTPTNGSPGTQLVKVKLKKNV